MSKPDLTLGGIHDCKSRSTLNDLRIFRKRGRSSYRNLSNVNGGNGVACFIREADVIARLTDIEFGCFCAQGTVKNPRIVVQVANKSFRRVCHPNSAIIDIDFSGRYALVKDGKSRDGNSKSSNQRSRKTASINARCGCTMLLLHIFFTTLADG